MKCLGFISCSLLLSSLTAQTTNPRFTFSLGGPCDGIIVGPPGGILDDGTGGLPYFNSNVDGTLVPRMQPGYTWDVVLTTEDNPSSLGVFSWAFGVGVEGAIEITDITTDGTAGCAWSRPFPECRARFHTEAHLTGPPDGIGPQTEENRGGVSVVRLNLDGVEMLPATGAISIAKIRVSGRFPETEGETVTGGAFFAIRYIAPDRGMLNAVYWGGGTGEPILVDRGNPPLVVVPCEVTLKASSVAAFVRCDPNDDGQLTIADAVWILNELFLGGALTRCPTSADCNGDGERDITDAVYGLTHLFFGGPPPPVPYPTCGRMDVALVECPPPQSSGCP